MDYVVPYAYCANCVDAFLNFGLFVLDNLRNELIISVYWKFVD